jgi:hypothetical protein
MGWATFWVIFSQTHLVALVELCSSWLVFEQVLLCRIGSPSSSFEGRFIIDWPSRRDYLERPGLPDGLFSKQKFLFGYFLEGLGIHTVGIFCSHLEHFTTIWYVSWPFGILCGHSVNFTQFWYVVPRKIGQPRRVLCPGSTSSQAVEAGK